jgi:hypothetical protein
MAMTPLCSPIASGIFQCDDEVQRFHGGFIVLDNQ